jgi:hypothetical protein
MIAGNKNGIDFGGLFNTGVDLIREKLFQKKTGPVAVAEDHTPVQSGVPTWVVPVAVVAVVLLFGKKLFK